MAVYYRSEVLRHNTPDDCWIIVRNRVYDITRFLTQHPGGRDILMTRAGEDATSYFITRHAQDKAVWRALEAMCVGTLHPSEQVTANDLDEPFLVELIDRCYREKLYRAPVWYRNRYFWIRAVNLVVFFSLSVLVLYSQVHWYIKLPAVLLQSLVGVSLFGFLAHESTHRHFPKSGFGRFLLRVGWPVMWPFISQTPLQYEHNSHHIKIGDPEFDYEVAGFASVMRYSGHVTHAPIHRRQHRVAYWVYPFYANIITTIGGIRSGFWEKHNRQVGLEHTLSILGAFMYYMVLPTLVNGNLGWHLLWYLVYQCALFYGIYLTAAINHFVPMATTPIPEQYQNRYGYYVCANTSNFCSSSAFWYWFSGGFNIQIEHHLIPFVPVENLRKLIPAVKELCAKYNYPYLSYPRFGDLWKDHYRYLATLSEAVPGEAVNAEMANKTGYQAR